MSEGDVVQHAFTKLKEDIRRTNRERAPFVIKFINHVYENWGDLIAEAHHFQAQHPDIEVEIRKSYLDVDDEGETFNFWLLFGERKISYNVGAHTYVVDDTDALFNYEKFIFVSIRYVDKDKHFRVNVKTKELPRIDTAFVDLNYRRRHSCPCSNI